MKTPLLLLSLFALLTVRVGAAVTNLNPSMTVELPLQLGVSPAITNLSQSVVIDRPLDDVIKAMQTWYFSTNYHGWSRSIYETNAVPGVSYTFKIMDCTFPNETGVFGGEMAAIRLTPDSTKLVLRSNDSLTQSANTIPRTERGMSLTLNHVAKLAEGK